MLLEPSGDMMAGLMRCRGSNRMPLTMSQICRPAFRRGLDALADVLGKAEAQANERRIDPAVLLGARLFPDMFSLVRQVQVGGDFAKNTVARLAGLDIPAFPDTETSFAELQDRIARTLAFVESVPADAIDGSEHRPVSVKTGRQVLEFTGQPYLLQFALPNFYFHLATAYDILRHNGIALSKRDFIGEF